MSPVEHALREGASGDVTFFGGAETNVAYLEGSTTTDVTRIPFPVDEAEGSGLQLAANEIDEPHESRFPGAARPDQTGDGWPSWSPAPSPRKPGKEYVIELDGTAGATQLDNWLLGQGIRVTGDVTVPEANAWAAFPEGVIPPTAIVANRIQPANFRAGDTYRVVTTQDEELGQRRLDVIEFSRDGEPIVTAFLFEGKYYDEDGIRLRNRPLAQPLPPWSPVLEGFGAPSPSVENSDTGRTRGMLFATGPGEELRAPRGGRVINRTIAGSRGVTGMEVVIVHDERTQSVFTVGEFSAREDAVVERGALVGRTPTGDQEEDSFTYYEYLIDGKPVDPVIHYSSGWLIGEERDRFIETRDRLLKRLNPE